VVKYLQLQQLRGVGKGLETTLLRLSITELQICNFILKKAILYFSKLKYLNERKLQAT